MLDTNNKASVWLLHGSLFVVTLITTTLAGAEWMHGKFFFLNKNGLGWNDWMDSAIFLQGLQFSIPFMATLTVHEFGHYITALRYGIRVTLPYYIPMWFGLGTSIGTIGAFIKIKDKISSKKQYFDVGIAGPLSGFVLGLAVLIYGFTHLPAPEHIFTIHPEYAKYGLDYPNYVYKGVEGGFYLGKNLLFVLLEYLLVDQPAAMPNAYELMHYPFLFAGYLACFFTALNLMPIGQLDGGHIVYGLLGGAGHRIVSHVAFVGFVFYAGLGTVSPYSFSDFLDLQFWLYIFFLYLVFSKVGGNFKNTITLVLLVVTAQFGTLYLYPKAEGYSGWLFFALVLGRFLGTDHPTAHNEEPLDFKRKLLGWVSLLIFVLCFTPTPFVFET